MRSKQSSLFKYFEDDQSHKRYGRTEHGGLKSKNIRKNERPLSTKRPTHLVLKSLHAKGHLSFLNFKNKAFIEKLIREKAKKFGIKIQDFANVGNHIHLKIKYSSRLSFQKFLKSITSQIARFVTGAKRGKPFGKAFWEGLAYTRVLTSKLEELNLKGYIEANRVQAAKSYQAREKYLKEFREWVQKRYQRNGLEDPLPGFSTG